MIVLAIFLAKLLSPIGGVVALAIGCVNGSRWMIGAGAIGGAVVSELILKTAQFTYSFQPAVFLIGVIAFAIWAALGNILVRRLFAKSETK